MTGQTLKGKTAVITGGARGIGKAVADALIEKGANVVIGDLDGEGAAVAASYNTKGKRAAFLISDASKYKDNVALFKLAEKEFGGVQIACLNAGIASNSNNLFSVLDDDLDEQMIDINVTSVIKGTKVATLHLAKSGGGVIINTASVAGLYPGGVNLAPYTASKHAVVGYTRSLDMLSSVCNVRVNCVCPYWVETDLLSSLHNEASSAMNPYEKLVANSPRTKISTVVDAFLTLILDESRVGQTLLALPDGLKLHERPDTYESISLDPVHVQEFIKSNTVYLKGQLAQALERYESA